MPRLVFGLLSGPMLTALRVHPDVRVHAASMATALDCSALARMLYPRMLPWSDVDTLGGGQLSLARAAMAATGAPIYLLDALTTVVVYYAAVPPGAPQQPMPPPQKARGACLAVPCQRLTHAFLRVRMCRARCAPR